MKKTRRLIKPSWRAVRTILLLNYSISKFWHQGFNKGTLRRLFIFWVDLLALQSKRLHKTQQQRLELKLVWSLSRDYIWKKNMLLTRLLVFSSRSIKGLGSEVADGSAGATHTVCSAGRHLYEAPGMNQPEETDNIHQLSQESPIYGS